MRTSSGQPRKKAKLLETNYVVLAFELQPSLRDAEKERDKKPD